MPPVEVFEVIGVRGVIVSPASAIGGPLTPVVETSYEMLDIDEVEDALGDIKSISSEYVASMVQSESVVAEEEVEFGHMPPKT